MLPWLTCTLTPQSLCIAFSFVCNAWFVAYTARLCVLWAEWFAESAMNNVLTCRANTSVYRTAWSRTVQYALSSSLTLCDQLWFWTVVIQYMRLVWRWVFCLAISLLPTGGYHLSFCTLLKVCWLNVKLQSAWTMCHQCEDLTAALSCHCLCFVVYLLVLWQHRAADFAWYSLDCLLAEYDTESADVLSNMHEVIHGHGSILAAPRCWDCCDTHATRLC